MTLQQALATSPNTGFVKLEDDLGLAKVVDMAVAMGMKGYSLNAGDVDQTFTDSTNTYAQELVAAEGGLVHARRHPGEPAGAGQRRRHHRLRRALVPADPDQQRAGPGREGGDAQGARRPVPTSSPASSRRRRTCPARSRRRWATPSPPTAGTAHQSAVATGWNLTQGTAAGKTGTTGDYKSSAYLGLHAVVQRVDGDLRLPEQAAAHLHVRAECAQDRHPDPARHHRYLHDCAGAQQRGQHQGDDHRPDRRIRPGCRPGSRA